MYLHKKPIPTKPILGSNVGHCRTWQEPQASAVNIHFSVSNISRFIAYKLASSLSFSKYRVQRSHCTTFFDSHRRYRQSETASQHESWILSRTVAIPNYCKPYWLQIGVDVRFPKATPQRWYPERLRPFILIQMEKQKKRKAFKKKTMTTTTTTVLPFLQDWIWNYL
jgi:hypothetical protein